MDISEYLSAAQDIIRHPDWESETQYIYLATEDPLGIQESKAQMPPIERFTFLDQLPKTQKNSGPSVEAKQPEGQDELYLLVALLILLEANKFVLTTERKSKFKYAYIFKIIILSKIIYIKFKIIACRECKFGTFPDDLSARSKYAATIFFAYSHPRLW